MVRMRSYKVHFVVTKEEELMKPHSIINWNLTEGSVLQPEDTGSNAPVEKKSMSDVKGMMNDISSPRF
jgi:hypothetical protein